MKNPGIRLHTDLKGLLKIAYFTLSDIQCQQTNPGLWAEIETLCEQRRQAFNSPGEALEYLKPARTLYYRCGMEPTRIRPASEALFRRIIKGKGLYRINSLVDAGNYCSLRFWLPIGLYDANKLRGDVEIRFGKEGESYEGIGKEKINLANRLALVDDAGPFGNPSSDSKRTSIDLETSGILMVIYAPGEYRQEKLQNHLESAIHIFSNYHPSARLISSGILY